MEYSRLGKTGFVVSLLFGCASTNHAVVSTAAMSNDPWTCPEQETRVSELSEGRYRLEGCGQTAVYNYDPSYEPPRCTQ